MSEDLPERDPLADLVSRSLGTRIEAVRAEEVPGDDGVERRRLRFVTKDGQGSVIFERSPRGETLEAQLLPFLARRTDRVPAVHARGLPPPHAALGPWLLLEDVLAAPSGCDDVAGVVRAKLALERALARDVPALRALGVREDPLPAPTALGALPRVLRHGDLRCAVTRRVARGVVIVAWSHASLGPPALDVAQLVLALERGGRSAEAAAARDAFATESELRDGGAFLAAAIAWLREGRPR